MKKLFEKYGITYLNTTEFDEYIYIKYMVKFNGGEMNILDVFNDKLKDYVLSKYH